MPDGAAIQLKMRSLVGLLPMCAATVFDGELLKRYPMFMERPNSSSATSQTRCRRWRTSPTPTRRADGSCRSSTNCGCGGSSRPCSTRKSSSAPTGSARSRAAIATSRASSTGAAQEYNVHYLPAESDTGMFGGNSNWRGPVWFPMNVVILRGLAQLHRYYGDELKVECPTGSGQEMNLLDVATEIATRLATTFTNEENGRRPGLRRNREVPDRSSLARPDPVPRVLPRRQRRRHRRQPPDGLDRHRRAVVHARRRAALRAVRGRPRGRLRAQLMHPPPRHTVYKTNEVAPSRAPTPSQLPHTSS